MLTIKGRFEGGVVHPAEPVAALDQEEVLITFLNERPAAPAGSVQEIDSEDAARIDAGSEALTALINECQVDTGIEDLAHQHDHYIHGTPKREN